MAQLHLDGAHVALVTPLTADRDVQLGDVRALVRRAVDDGLAGVLVAGSTGEGALLEPEQRVELTRVAREAVDAADRQVTLFAGASGPTVASVHADVERLAAAGADAVLVLAPSLYPLQPEELAAFHRDVAERATVPTLVYHLPQYTGSALTPDVLRDLLGQPGLVGIKDSSPDDDRRRAFVEVARASAEPFAVLSGHAPTLRSTLTAGANGSITAVANLRARTVVALQAAIDADDADAAARHQGALDRLTTGLKRTGSSTAAATKAALQLEGAIEERWCVAPLSSTPPDRLDHIRTALLSA